MTTPDQDMHWMQRALELARRGIAVSSPNPAVGCVILDRAGQVAGEGWHEYDLLDHAEIIALRVAEQHAKERLRGGTAYVTLEPCKHTGRTGPCTEALIAAVGAVPDPKVVIRGDAKLNFRVVRQAMQVIEQAGFRGVGLVAKRAVAKGD